jgi:hypothetical protein
MAHVDLTPDRVRVRLSRWERVGALHGDLAIPRDAVLNVDVVADTTSAVEGIRAPGYGLPGHAAVGTWRGRGWKDFVVAYAGRPGVVIDLRSDRSDTEFRRLVVTVDDPETIAAALS